MRILFISNTFPSDPAKSVHGIFQRMGLFVDAALQLSETLDMLFFVPPAIDVSHKSVKRYEDTFRKIWSDRINLFLVPHAVNPNFHKNWDRYGAGIFDVFRQESYSLTSGAAQLCGIEACLARGPDAVVVQRLAAMLPLMRIRVVLPPVFFDLDDIEHRSHFRRVSTCPRWPGERVTLLHTPALKAAEMRAIRASAQTFVCSEIDRAYLSKQAKTPNVFVAPNAVQMPLTRSLIPDGANLLFVGTFAYQPNVQAADFLVGEIWPLVRAKVPQARLRIVGSQQEVLRYFSNPPDGVDYLGFVPNIDSVYDETRVVCCPIFAGAGTRIKIIEAAARAKAVVSTTMGAEGLEFEGGTAIQIRDKTQEFANACVALLQDPALAKKIGDAARRTFLQKYDRSAVVAQIVACIGASLAAQVQAPAQ